MKPDELTGATTRASPARLVRSMALSMPAPETSKWLAESNGIETPVVR